MRSRRTRSLCEIVHIRALQRQAGEMRLGHAVAVLDDQLGRQKTEQQKQDARERLWRKTLDGGFDLVLSRAWSGAVTEGLRQLAAAETSVAEARRDKGHASEALQMAQANAEAAEGLERRASRQDRREFENRSLMDLSDLFARRSGHED